MASSSGPSSSAPVRTQAVTAAGEPVQLDPVEDALASFRNGEFLVVVDDMDRENEGDLIIAGDKVSQQQMAWLIQHSSCVSSIPPEILSLPHPRADAPRSHAPQGLHLHLPPG